MTENSSGEQYNCPNGSVADPIRSGNLSISCRHHCAMWWQLDLPRVWCHEVIVIADYHSLHAIFGISKTLVPWQDVRGKAKIFNPLQVLACINKQISVWSYHSISPSSSDFIFARQGAGLKPRLPVFLYGMLPISQEDYGTKWNQIFTQEQPPLLQWGDHRSFVSARPSSSAQLWKFRPNRISAASTLVRPPVHRCYTQCVCLQHPRSHLIWEHHSVYSHNGNQVMEKCTLAKNFALL